MSFSKRWESEDLEDLILFIHLHCHRLLLHWMKLIPATHPQLNRPQRESSSRALNICRLLSLHLFHPLHHYFSYDRQTARPCLMADPMHVVVACLMHWTKAMDSSTWHIQGCKYFCLVPPTHYWDSHHTLVIKGKRSVTDITLFCIYWFIDILLSFSILRFKRLSSFDVEEDMKRVALF